MITLQGQSAGAIIIGLLMLAPEYSNLFNRVIMQSASPTMLKQLYTIDNYQRALQLSNCSLIDNGVELNDSYSDDSNEYDYDYDIVDDVSMENLTAEMICLTKLAKENLLKTQEKMLNENGCYFFPSIPTKLLPEFASIDTVKNILQKEILIGANTNESTVFLYQLLQDILPMPYKVNISQDIISTMINRIVGQDHAKQFSSIMHNLIQIKNPGLSPNDIIRESLIFLSDFLFKGPVFKFAKYLSETRKRNVYLYMFNEPCRTFPKWLGSGHWCEMDYVFGIPMKHRRYFTSKQQKLSRRMIKTWTHFARTG